MGRRDEDISCEYLPNKHTYFQSSFLSVSVSDLTQIMSWRVLSAPSQARGESAGSSNAQCCLLLLVKWNQPVPCENPKSALKFTQQQKEQAKFLGKGVKVEKEPARDVKALLFFTLRVFLSQANKRLRYIWIPIIIFMCLKSNPLLHKICPYVSKLFLSASSLMET